MLRHYEWIPTICDLLHTQFLFSFRKREYVTVVIIFCAVILGTMLIIYFSIPVVKYIKWHSYSYFTCFMIAITATIQHAIIIMFYLYLSSQIFVFVFVFVSCLYLSYLCLYVCMYEIFIMDEIKNE